MFRVLEVLDSHWRSLSQFETGSCKLFCRCKEHTCNCKYVLTVADVHFAANGNLTCCCSNKIIFTVTRAPLAFTCRIFGDAWATFDGNPFLRMYLWWSFIPCIYSHARWSSRRQFRSLLLCPSSVQRYYFPLFVDFGKTSSLLIFVAGKVRGSFVAAKLILPLQR